MSQLDLEREYSPRAAEQRTRREAQQRKLQAEQKRLSAEPIADREQLGDAVAQLASAWGLKRKGGRNQ